MKIKISGEEYLACVTASETYWSENKKGFWGKGIINSANDPHKVTRTGLLGEMAVSKYLGLNMTENLEYKRGGNTKDFIINDWSIEIKTSSYNYGAALIRCKSSNGKNVFKPADIFIAATIESENREVGEATVCIKGWETLDFVLGLPETPARVGKHLNYELKFGELRGIGKLKSFLKKRKVIKDTNKKDKNHTSLKPS